jgi:membrane-bound lytic murein transglycosylase A
MSSSWLSQILSLLIISLFSTACTNPTRRPKQILAPPTLTDQTIKLGPAIKVNEQISLHPTHFQHLNGWHQDNHQLAYKAFKRSCARWQTQADNKPLSGIFRLGQLSDWKRLCAITVPKGEEKRFFEAGFQPYAISDRNNFEGLFTGYYLPELHGSYQQSPRFKVPIYGIPADLLKRDEKVGRLQNGQFVPYYSRAEITAGSLRGKKAELL